MALDYNNTTHIKRARILAIAWTLLIFIACLTPGKDLPAVDVPFIDKWVHFILFGVFAFLWLCGVKAISAKTYLFVFIITALYGYIIEVLQYLLVFLGRSYDIMDAAADAVGGLLGIFTFISASAIYNARKRN